MEAGLNPGVVGGSSFADVPFIPKGVIWLFLATIVEATPAVSLSNFVAPLCSHYVAGVCLIGSKR